MRDQQLRQRVIVPSFRSKVEFELVFTFGLLHVLLDSQAPAHHPRAEGRDRLIPRAGRDSSCTLSKLVRSNIDGRVNKLFFELTDFLT